MPFTQSRRKTNTNARDEGRKAKSELGWKRTGSMIKSDAERLKPGLRLTRPRAQVASGRKTR